MSNSDPSESKSDAAESQDGQDPAAQELSEEEAKKQAIKKRNAEWEANAQKYNYLGNPF